MKLVLVIFLFVFSAFGQTPTMVRPHAEPPLSQLKIIRQTGSMEYEAAILKAQRVNDPILDKYLNSLLEKLLANSPKTFSGPFRLTVIIHPYEQGISFANGDIVLELKFICGMANEDFLAYVLSHEINHFGFNHALYESQLRMKLRQWLNEEIKRKGNYLLAVREFERQMNDKVFIDEVEADLLAAKVLVTAGYWIDDQAVFQKLFKYGKDYPDPPVRASSIISEMKSWQKLCPNCSARTHPRSPVLATQCSAHGIK